MSTLNPQLCLQIIKLAGDVHPNPGPGTKLNIMYSNVNSLMAESGRRLNELHLRLKMENIGIACLTETGTNLDLKLCSIEGYHELHNCYFKDKNRGLLILVHESIGTTRRFDLEIDESCLWSMLYH
jgi:hypothetical protein